MTALLEARALKRHFPVRGTLFGKRQFVRAVDGVDLQVQPGESIPIFSGLAAVEG